MRARYTVTACDRCSRSCSAKARARWTIRIFLGCTYAMGAHLEVLSRPCCSYRTLRFCTARCMHAANDGINGRAGRGAPT